MAHYYQLTAQGLKEADASNNDLTIYRTVSEEDERLFLNKYKLPQDIFYFDEIKPVAPRFEKISNPYLGETRIFILSNVTPTEHAINIEEQLESHVFILGEKQLFWFVKDAHSQFDSELLETYGSKIEDLQTILMYATLLSFTHYTKELNNQKKQIDYLNTRAPQKTSNKILSQVTETERNLVLLEHTIESQENAIQYLLNDQRFIQSLNNAALVHDVKWYNRQVNRLVHVYRDLFDAVSSLYSDIITNNLNQLMKFLSSLSIILAASSIIAELWGMNTGGLPFEHHEYGTFIMIGIAFIAGLCMYLFLRKRNFFDD